MPNTDKYLDEDGVRRLWAAIEAKFIDINELPQDGTIISALTNEEIDAITGYVEPNNNGGGE